MTNPGHTHWNWNDDRLDRLAAAAEANSRDIAASTEAVAANTIGIRQLREAVAVNTADIGQLREAVADNTASIGQLQREYCSNCLYCPNPAADLEPKR